MSTVYERKEEEIYVQRSERIFHAQLFIKLAYFYTRRAEFFSLSLNNDTDNGEDDDED
jgi:hypothetical protein